MGIKKKYYWVNHSHGLHVAPYGWCFSNFREEDWEFDELTYAYKFKKLKDAIWFYMVWV